MMTMKGWQQQQLKPNNCWMMTLLQQLAVELVPLVKQDTAISTVAAAVVEPMEMTMTLRSGVVVVVEQEVMNTLRLLAAKSFHHMRVNIQASLSGVQTNCCLTQQQMLQRQRLP